MALNWNIERCKDYKKLIDEKEGVITDAIIWLTMSIGMPEITKKNHEEFFLRTQIHQKINGAFLRKGNGAPFYMTIEDVQKRIGLYTNADKFSKAVFKSRIYNSLVNSAIRSNENEMEEYEEEK